MSDDIYTRLGIDKSKLKRDYIENPLKRISINTPVGYTFEIPDKDDLMYLYNVVGLSRTELSIYFGISIAVIGRILRKYNIKCDKEKRTEKIKKYCLKKYGVDNYAKTKECKDKTIATNLKKYGVEYHTKRKETMEKMKDIFLKKYGATCNFLRKDVIENRVKNNMEQYGVPWYVQTLEFKDKSRITCIEHFNKEFYTQTEEYRKRKEETCLKKYGVNSYSKTKEYNKKVNETLRKNGTYNISTKEDTIYEMLCEKFGTVERQYRSELYPYRCDFYIPNIDTYIEYQGWFGHGKEPYVANDSQKLIVEQWLGKNTPQYNRAIDTWTQKDVEKRECAKRNNLNYLEFFNINEFTNWYNHYNSQ